MEYKDIGFRCGIEIHQQLNTDKLFCSCPSANLRDTEPDVRFERRLRAVAGETGKIDVAANYEMNKSKKFIYEADSKDTCLVELDEEPPHPINKDAIDVALEVSKLLNAKIVDEIQVMRKTVIDGSNVSGFQRTALVAYDGYVETSKGKVRIPSILLEEEAAQRIEEKGDSIRFRLDRLGIPLIEIGTEPDIIDPEHARETAEKIGMILRSTGKVKRGIGTIRQDVNVSIKGRNRVEIKGFQDIRSMSRVIEEEIQRQKRLGKKEDAHVRKVEPDNKTSYLRPMPGSARLYPETDVVPLKVDIKKIKTSELIEDKIKRYEKLGLTHDLAVLTAKSDKAEIFEKFVKEFKNIKPSFIASTLTSALKEIKRKYETDVSSLTEKEFQEIFNALEKGKISKDLVTDILIDYAKDKFVSFDKYAVADTKELEEEIKKIVDSKPDLSTGAYMGMIMKKFQGKVDGKTAMEILKKIAK